MIDPENLQYVTDQISFPLVDYRQWSRDDVLRAADNATLILTGQAQGALAQLVASLAATVVLLQAD